MNKLSFTKVLWQYGWPGKTTAVMLWAGGATLAAMIFMEAFFWTTVLIKITE